MLQEKQVRKLGFREKDEYAKLETQIEDVTEEKAQLEAKIAETAQLGDFQKVAEMTEQLPALSEKIDKMTDRYALASPEDVFTLLQEFVNVARQQQAAFHL